MKKLALPLLMLPLVLGGCIKFAADPPPSLLTLSPAAGPQVGAVQAADKTITIAVPVSPAELNSQRVPVRATDTSLAYLKDAVWVEPPNRLFARLLSDTVAARTGRMVLSRRQSLTDPGATLTGELRAFGVEAGSNEVVVTYDASLARDNGGKVEKRRFEARVSVAAVEVAQVGVALNMAANEVATEVADWVGR